ncbi:hypothetical protein [Frondihabitans cladoniiphilus]|uniref:hypothetical protein n=1 Tax=Frondihabitans cladoniiphilus TaxID=715785 RepID=UPI0031EB9DFA
MIAARGGSRRFLVPNEAIVIAVLTQSVLGAFALIGFIAGFTLNAQSARNRVAAHLSHDMPLVVVGAVLLELLMLGWNRQTLQPVVRAFLVSALVLVAAVLAGFVAWLATR